MDAVRSFVEYLAFIFTLDKVEGSTVLKLRTAIVVYERFAGQYKYSSLMTHHIVVLLLFKTNLISACSLFCIISTFNQNDLIIMIIIIFL